MENKKSSVWSIKLSISKPEWEDPEPIRKVLFEELLKRYPEIRSVADPIRVPSNFLAGISELKVKI